MPAEVFGLNYPFLEQENLLSFLEIEALVRSAVGLGVKKVRLTGGEPLLRKGVDDLVAMISAVDGVEEVALTTNGVLLAHYAERLVHAGLSRVTVSLDALDPEVFSQMNGVGAKVERVLKGIEMAELHGLRVKINMVVQKGVNESQVLPLLTYFMERDVQVRFIEYMDVGETNKWHQAEVLPTADLQELISTQYTLMPHARAYGAVAETYDVYEGTEKRGTTGFISSVTRPFCQDCGRMRISADGKIYGCLFGSEGVSVKEILREQSSPENLTRLLADFWKIRDDRYSELRGKVKQSKVEMSYIGG